MSMCFDERFIRSTLSTIVALKNEVLQDSSFAVDTRTLQPGEIFVAVQGEHVDGHDFIEDAVKKGASGLIIAAHKQEYLKKIDAKKLSSLFVLVVPDPLQGLFALAQAWRAQFNYPVIGITGSVGKTSTKETLAHILTVHGMSFIASRGNQNTKIGAAITMLKMRSDLQAAVFEIGINKRGEMADIVAMLRPTTAIITNIGHCHMEGLGSLNDIALEKRDIFKYFTEQNIGIINGDQSLLAQVSYAHPVVKFGSKTTNQIQARKIRAAGDHVTFVMKMYREKHNVTLPNPHVGAVYNVLAASAAAIWLGVPQSTILKAIVQPVKVPGRFEQRELAGFKGLMINDCYNANPESMKVALLAFQKVETGAQKIAVLGDMLELGVNSPFWHRQLGRFLRKVPSLNQVILVGDLVKWTKKTAPLGLSVEIVPTWSAAVEILQGKLAQESVVLVKGSRGMALENLITKFTAKQS